jgi:cell division protein FtsI/penicillin-binding protein 2
VRGSLPVFPALASNNQPSFVSPFFLGRWITLTYIPRLRPTRGNFMRRLFTPTFIVVHLVLLHLVVVWFRAPGSAPASPAATTTVDGAPAGPTGAPSAAPRPVTRPGPLDLDKVRSDDGRHMTADLGNGFTGELSLDARLQKESRKILDRGKVPVGAVVLLDVETGDVLALADRYKAEHPAAPQFGEGGPQSLALRAFAPAASVYKIVTAAALLEAGVSGSAAFPYLGGHHRVGPDHIAAPPKGAPLATLGDGLSKSINGLFARLAAEKLDHDALDGISSRFFFNQVLPFPAMTEASLAQVPRQPLERARMAAGFFHSKLTPLHAAVLAAAVAKDGMLPAPRLVQRIIGPDGAVEEAPPPAALGRAIEAETAKTVGKMLRQTTEDGTARRSFAKVPKALEGIDVAGKTGTLNDDTTRTEYTWFVGFAPAQSPRVAFAVLVGNGPLWYVRATDVARDVLAAYFEAEAPAVATR